MSSRCHPCLVARSKFSPTFMKHRGETNRMLDARVHRIHRTAMSSNESSSRSDMRNPRRAFTARVISTIFLPRSTQRDDPNCIANPTIKSTIMNGQKTNTGRMNGTRWFRRHRTIAIDATSFVVAPTLRTRLVRLLRVCQAIPDPSSMSVRHLAL